MHCNIITVRSGKGGKRVSILKLGIYALQPSHHPNIVLIHDYVSILKLGIYALQLTRCHTQFCLNTQGFNPKTRNLCIATTWR